MNKESLNAFKEVMEGCDLNHDYFGIWALHSFNIFVLHKTGTNDENIENQTVKLSWWSDEGKNRSITIIDNSNYIDESGKKDPHISVFADSELTADTGLKIFIHTSTGQKIRQEEVCARITLGIIKAYTSYFPESQTEKLKRAQPKRID